MRTRLSRRLWVRKTRSEAAVSARKEVRSHRLGRRSRFSPGIIWSLRSLYFSRKVKASRRWQLSETRRIPPLTTSWHIRTQVWSRSRHRCRTLHEIVAPSYQVSLWLLRTLKVTNRQCQSTRAPKQRSNHRVHGRASRTQRYHSQQVR